MAEKKYLRAAVVITVLSMALAGCQAAEVRRYAAPAEDAQVLNGSAQVPTIHGPDSAPEVKGPTQEM